MMPCAAFCEDRIVWHRIDDAVRGHRSEGCGLDDRHAVCSSCSLPDLERLRLKAVQIGNGALRMRGRREDEALLV
jgi:hypothetical protein